MTDDQYQKAQELSHVTFLPGSFDKRFTRSVASKPKEGTLTEKQAILLEQMYHRYRKQIPNHGEKCRVCSGDLPSLTHRVPNIEDEVKLERWKSNNVQTEVRANVQKDDPQLPLFD